MKSIDKFALTINTTRLKKQQARPYYVATEQQQSILFLFLFLFFVFLSAKRKIFVFPTLGMVYSKN